MKTYKVSLMRLAYDYADVEVQAVDEDDARDKAKDVACEGDLDWRDEEVTGIYVGKTTMLEPCDPRHEPDYE